MKLKLIVAISVLAAAPSDAWTQQPAKVTKADAQRVLKIQSDKAKTQVYCEMAKIGNHRVVLEQTSRL